MSDIDTDPSTQQWYDIMLSEAKSHKTPSSQDLVVYAVESRLKSLQQTLDETFDTVELRCSQLRARDQEISWRKVERSNLLQNEKDHNKAMLRDVAEFKALQAKLDEANQENRILRRRYIKATQTQFRMQSDGVVDDNLAVYEIDYVDGLSD